MVGILILLLSFCFFFLILFVQVVGVVGWAANTFTAVRPNTKQKLFCWRRLMRHNTVKLFKIVCRKPGLFLLTNQHDPKESRSIRVDLYKLRSKAANAALYLSIAVTGIQITDMKINTKIRTSAHVGQLCRSVMPNDGTHAS